MTRPRAQAAHPPTPQTGFAGLLAACARDGCIGGCMREITHGDIRVAARVLLAHPQEEWPALMARMLQEAHCADCYHKASGRAHPRLGAGTLMNAALALGPVPEPMAADKGYLVAIAAVIAAVQDWRTLR